MVAFDSPTFLKICKELESKRGYEFELICNDYLKARFPNLVPWISKNSESTIPGTPDAFLIDSSGAVIAGQYGSSPEKWRAKLFGNAKEIGDAEKVANVARDSKLTIARLVFCTTAALDLPTLHAAQKEVKSRYGFPAEICDLRRLCSDIETRYPGIAARRLGIPIPLQYFMTIDDYIDSGNQRYWPKRKDIGNGRVFTPSHYLAEIKTKISKDKYCLLTGLSGSGKTVVAITYGLAWRGDLPIGNQHPEAPVFYLDAASNNSQDTGERWVRQVFDNDYQNALFIVDNCHLSPAAINTFCFQLRRRKLNHAAVLLISTPKVQESDWEVTPADYFEYFEQSNSIVEVQPESIYRGLLRQYSDMYRRNQPDRFVDVNDDFADEARNLQLANLCSHNLVAARGLLEAWGEIGGQLSSIDQGEVLNVLTKRHLTMLKAPALGPLCGLATYEISIHNAFISSLPENSVARLNAENLLIPNESQVYGRTFRVALHPQVANLLFAAYMRQQLGAEYEFHVEERKFFYLKQYLLSGAKNLAEVYKRLYQTRAGELQKRLLDDEELQSFINSRLNTFPLPEIVWYAYVLGTVNHDLGRSVLEKSYAESSPQDFQSRLLKTPPDQLVRVIEIFVLTSEELAKTVLTQLPADIVAASLNHSHLSRMHAWISRSPVSVAASLGYSIEWRKEVAEKLDLDLLVERSFGTPALGVMWFVRSLVDIAPEQARKFFDKLTPHRLGGLLRDKPASVITTFLDILRSLGYSSEWRRQVAEYFDIDILMKYVTQMNLQDFMWFFRSFLELAPTKAKELLDRLTPERLGLLMSGSEVGVISTTLDIVKRPCEGTDFVTRVIAALDLDDLIMRISKRNIPRLFWFVRTFSEFVPDVVQRVEVHLEPQTMITQIQKHGDITHLSMLWNTTSEDFMSQVLHLMDTSVAVEIFNRSKLADIAAFVEHRGDWGKRHYQLFAAKHLKEKLATNDLPGIGRFLTRLQRGYYSAAVSATQLLLKTDLNARIANNFVGLSLLCKTVAEIDPAYKQQLLQNISAEACREGVTHSRIEDISAIIYMLSEPRHVLLQAIEEALRDTDLTPQIAEASVKALGYLLWHIRSVFGEELTHKYAALVDNTVQPDTLRNADITDLTAFLWTFVNTSSSHQNFKLIEHEGIHERIKKELVTEPGNCMQMLGAISLVKASMVIEIFSPSVDLNVIGGKLARSLKKMIVEGYPQKFALALEAVSLLDQDKADTLLKHVLRRGSFKQDLLAGLVEALTKVITPLSQQVLTRTIARIEHMTP